MLKKPVTKIIALVLAGAVLLAGCGARSNDLQIKEEVITVTDMANRQVVLKIHRKSSGHRTRGIASLCLRKRCG